MKIRLKGQYANSKASSASNGDSSQQPANGTELETANGGVEGEEDVADEGGEDGDEQEGQGDGEGEEIEEEEEAVDDDDFAEASSSQSSEADEEFLNEPIGDLPESSGDEYTAPSTKPRGRPPGSRNKRTIRKARSGSPSESGVLSSTAAESAGGNGRRPIRQSRSSINLAEKPISRNGISSSSSRTPASPRRGAAAATTSSAADPSSSRRRDSNAANVSSASISAAAAPIKRGRGRPPGSLNKKKGKARSASLQPQDEDDSVMEEDDDNEESGMVEDDDDEEEEGNSTMQSGRSTPARVVYGADGRRRGGAVAGPKSKAVKGSRFEVDNDELALPMDTNGEKKIDANGRLLGGREYKMITFTSPTRPEPERLYVLAIDAARCAGFRDSLYFFRRNPWLHKVNCSQEEKEMLIEMGRLHQNLRSRQVTIVTARNLYKVFGARFVKNGRYVIDDYYEAASIAQGHKPGEYAHSEVYDPEIDNTTLAMPKIGSFAKSKAEGRPAYMRMEKAFELLHRGMPHQEREEDTPDVDNYATYEERERERNKKRKEEEGGSSEDEFGNRIVKKKRPSAFTTLALPQSYRPQDFGLITHPSYQSLVAGAQFGGNGQPPFGESWERSKARKPAPFLNGFNWMFEFARFTTRETNRAIMDIRKEWNGYHNITFGVPEHSLTSKEVEEEQEGVWDVSDEDQEHEYETLDQFRHREGLDAATATGPDGEIDDRKRGRSPSPSHLATTNGTDVKTKADSSMAEDREASEEEDSKVTGQSLSNGKLRSVPNHRLRRRRRRSPLRGYYDSHTRIPQIKLDTQPTQVLQWEQLDLLPRFGGPTGDHDRVLIEASRKGVATVEFAMRPV